MPAILPISTKAIRAVLKIRLCSAETRRSPFAFLDIYFS